MAGVRSIGPLAAVAALLVLGLFAMTALLPSTAPQVSTVWDADTDSLGESAPPGPPRDVAESAEPAATPTCEHAVAPEAADVCPHIRPVNERCPRFLRFASSDDGVGHRVAEAVLGWQAALAANAVHVPGDARHGATSLWWMHNLFGLHAGETITYAELVSRYNVTTVDVCPYDRAASSELAARCNVLFQVGGWKCCAQGNCFVNNPGVYEGAKACLRWKRQQGRLLSRRTLNVVWHLHTGGEASSSGHGSSAGAPLAYIQTLEAHVAAAFAGLPLRHVLVYDGDDATAALPAGFNALSAVLPGLQVVPTRNLRFAQEVMEHADVLVSSGGSFTDAVALANDNLLYWQRMPARPSGLDGAHDGSRELDFMERLTDAVTIFPNGTPAVSDTIVRQSVLGRLCGATAEARFGWSDAFASFARDCRAAANPTAPLLAAEGPTATVTATATAAVTATSTVPATAAGTPESTAASLVAAGLAAATTAAWAAQPPATGSEAVQAASLPRKPALALDVFEPVGATNTSWMACRVGTRDSVDLDNGAFFPTTRDDHTLAVVIPYRMREPELTHMLRMLQRKLAGSGMAYFVVVVNQVDPFRFNRGCLLNIGAVFARYRGADYVAMQDVDRFPVDDNLSYDYPGDAFVHLSPPWSWPNGYPNYVGGVGTLSVSNFLKINGFATDYWGWGFEDDDFYTRLARANISIIRPEVPEARRPKAVAHFHIGHFRDKYGTEYGYRVMGNPQTQFTGVSTTNYSVVAYKECAFVGFAARFVMIDVNVHCNVTAHPWCALENVPPEERKYSKR